MWQIRPWQAADALSAQQLIVSVLNEYGLKADVAGVDADVLDVETHYRHGGGEFFVVESAQRIVGTMGFSRIDSETCELRKMYLLPEVRGQGLGRQLLQLAFERSVAAGFHIMQLETASVLKEAIALYERHGFAPSCKPLHTARCDRLYQKSLR